MAVKRGMLVGHHRMEAGSVATGFAALVVEDTALSIRFQAGKAIPNDSSSAGVEL